MHLAELQMEHQVWLDDNFPNQLRYHPLLGLMEEVGELSHAHLKHEQGIRGYDHQTYVLEASDAVGDIVIYLASYCTTNGLDLDACVRNTWDRVQKRDWITDPRKGGES
jgi:NTP pyrophosphatase (non-canonical NTP hydrolase)